MAEIAIRERCRAMYHLGWASGTGGGGEHVYVAPSGEQKERLLPDDLFVLDGGGVFDIRNGAIDDRWMHVVVEPGDFILVPAQRHHRFMLTDEKHIRCVRLFKDASGWTPHYRA